MIDTASIEASIQLEFHDFLRFQYFHTLRRLWIGLILLLLLLVGLILLLALTWISSPREIFTNVFSNFGQMLFFAGLGIFSLLGGPYIHARRMMRTTPELQEMTAFRISPELIQTRSATTRMECQWERVHFVQETASFFLLYFAPQIATILPKRAFHSQQEVQQFRELVLAQLGQKKFRKPGVVGRWC